MDFSYRIVTADGVLVKTEPTLREAMKVADRYKAVVIKHGHAIYRGKNQEVRP